MSKPLVDQEREIKEMVRRAKGSRDRTGNFRRETLKKLMELTTAEYASLKSLAATGIVDLFSDFPEMEEGAINAVYDLCEDHSPAIRIEGYKSITLISRAQNRLVKRNADVLVQLLQSDDPQEVVHVKSALIEHLDLDPYVTIGVFCDQITPPDEQLEDEDKETRNRLRSLVIAFMTGEARRAIVERHAVAESKSEKMLVEGIIKAIPTLEDEETQSTTKLLLALPTFSTPNSAEGALLFTILSTKLKELMTRFNKFDTAIISRLDFHLDLLQDLVLKDHITPTTELLKFNQLSLIQNAFLIQVPHDVQLKITRNTARLLASFEADGTISETDKTALRNQVILAAPKLVQILLTTRSNTSSSRTACRSILESCQRYQRPAARPILPITMLNMLQASSLCQSTDSEATAIQDIIRSLRPKPPSAKEASNTENDQQPTATLTTLQPRTSSDAYTRERAAIVSNRTASISLERLGSASYSRLGPQLVKRASETLDNDDLRPQKKVRPGNDLNETRGHNDGEAGRSLLERMEKTSLAQRSSPGTFSRDGTDRFRPNSRGQIHSTKRMSSNQPATTRTSTTHENITDTDTPISGGLSIKGAASRKETTENENGYSTRGATTSLLDRMAQENASGRGRRHKGRGV